MSEPKVVWLNYPPEEAAPYASHPFFVEKKAVGQLPYLILPIAEDGSVNLGLDSFHERLALRLDPDDGMIAAYYEEDDGWYEADEDRIMDAVNALLRAALSAHTPEERDG